MIEYVILFLLKIKPYVQITLVALCAMKLLLFVVNRKRTWKMHHFFYFDNTHMILSHSESSYNNKKIQNNFTLVIIAMIAFQVINTIVSNMVVYTG